MTAHTHTVRVAGCYRCEVSSDEVLFSMEQEIEELEAENARMKRDIGAIFDAWNGRDDACQQPIHDEHGIHEGFGGLIVVAAMGSGAWDCEHDHMDGIDSKDLADPAKVWRCVWCGTERPNDNRSEDDSA